MKARQQKLGQTVADLDLLIAACAREQGLVVATLNYRDFSRIEDWHGKTGELVNNHGRKEVNPDDAAVAEIRAQLADDTLLMFRLEDFYEIFKQDAEWGAKLLGVTTHRHGMPMAVPFRAADSYIQKLLDQGVKIAICDQMETPKPANWSSAN